MCALIKSVKQSKPNEMFNASATERCMSYFTESDATIYVIFGSLFI